MPEPITPAQTRRGKDGLRLHQIRVLKVLAGAKAPISKAMIAKDAGVSAGVINLALSGDTAGTFKGLLDLGLVEEVSQDIDGHTENAYTITAKGRQEWKKQQDEPLPLPHPGPGGGNKKADSRRTTKLVDSKGRLALGNQFAGRMVLIDDSNPDRIVIEPAVAIPEREAWLYKNPQALSLLREGLDAVRAGRFAEHPPDISEDVEDDESDMEDVAT